MAVIHKVDKGLFLQLERNPLFGLLIDSLDQSRVKPVKRKLYSSLFSVGQNFQNYLHLPVFARG